MDYPWTRLNVETSNTCRGGTFWRCRRCVCSTGRLCPMDDTSDDLVWPCLRIQIASNEYVAYDSKTWFHASWIPLLFFIYLSKTTSKFVSIIYHGQIYSIQPGHVLDLVWPLKVIPATLTCDSVCLDTDPSVSGGSRNWSREALPLLPFLQTLFPLPLYPCPLSVF